MTTIAEKLTTINGALGDIKTAIEGKGVTPTGDITTFATAIGNISGGGGSGKYQLLQRVEDDNGNEIGTVSSIIKDTNGVEYAVVCLDKQYRTNNQMFFDSSLYESSEYFDDWAITPLTATQMYDNIVEYATYQSAAIPAPFTYCRNKTFTIDNVTYNAQLPTGREIVDIISQREALNALDTSTGDDIYDWELYWVGCFPMANTNEYFYANAIELTTWSSSFSPTKFRAIPVLEIPNT